VGNTAVAGDPVHSELAPGVCLGLEWGVRACLNTQELFICSTGALSWHKFDSSSPVCLELRNT